MREWQAGWPPTPELAAALPRRARGLPRRARRPGRAAEIAGTAGGMPDRVKCLHVLVGHALAAGPGVNPLGDDALAGLGRVVGGRAVRRRASRPRTRSA